MELADVVLFGYAGATNSREDRPMCEDYPCCGHTDGLGCDYVPDMDAIYASIRRRDYDPYYDPSEY